MTFDAPSGSFQATRQTVDKTPQQYSAPSAVQLQTISEAAQRAKAFVRLYVPATTYSLADFDKAFYIWQREDPRQFSEQEVIAMLGAHLGNQLVAELGMEWVVVTDQYGSDLATRGKEVDVLSYPFSSVAKRVERNQFNFMEGVYYATQEVMKDPKYDRR